MATKLKNVRLTSVDLVRAGANQEADICLFKGMGAEARTEEPNPTKTVSKSSPDRFDYIREFP